MSRNTTNGIGFNNYNSTAAATVTQPTCAVATATIEVTSPTGTGYQYSIDNGATWQTATTFPNIAANSNHTVIVKTKQDV